MNSRRYRNEIATTCVYNLPPHRHVRKMAAQRTKCVRVYTARTDTFGPNMEVRTPSSVITPVRCVSWEVRGNLQTTLKCMNKVHVLSPIQERVYVPKFMWEETRNMYTPLWIILLLSDICFLVCMFFAAILMPGIRLYWVEYGSFWCCDRVVTGWQRGELKR
jgi:hypothetical protein